MTTVKFTLPNPSPALLKELMEVIIRHDVRVPDSLSRAARPQARNSRPVVENAVPRGRPRSKTQNQAVNVGASTSTARPTGQRSQSASGRNLRARRSSKRRQANKNIAQNIIEHCPAFARDSKLVKLHGCSNYRATTPYAISNFKLGESAAVVNMMNADEPLVSLKSRLVGLGFPNSSMNNIAVVFEFAKEYIVAIFPGARAHKNLRVLKSVAQNVGEARRLALISAVSHINSFVDVRDYLPESYLKVVDVASDDDSDGDDDQDQNAPTDANDETGADDTASVSDYGAEVEDAQT
ncbi:putative coat protein [Ligustrum leprosis virus]|uniref:putative coat protein n=1 Tax=Ligustrum leprosis virus TaxID=2921792 RepID=UPI0024833A94|nr:putative coat protein [Ligustrum leprosis virus]UNH55563.1 putative coat protein [Ligustrum leprosis virus]